jgi:hypothetical protein
MGVKRLKIKDDLNYRRGYTWKACSYCDHYVSSSGMPLTGTLVKAEPRCKIIGLNPGRLYRINPAYVCDKYEYNSPIAKEFHQAQAAQPEEYEPYGPEWEKEMMKLDKKTLIGMLKAKGLEE